MDLMESELDEIGWEIISQDEVNLDATDFTSLLSRIQSNEPDVVWAVQTSSSGAGNLARQFSEAGFEDTHFFHNYGLTIADARETAGGAADGALTMLNAGRVDALLEEQGALEAWSERTDMDMTGSAALSYQNIKVIAEYASTFESLEAFRSASVEEWESTVLDHEPIPGGSGYISYQDNHQAAWGVQIASPRSATKFSTKSSISCGLRRSQPRRSTPQSTDQECRHTIGSVTTVRSDPIEFDQRLSDWVGRNAHNARQFS